ncbi:dihydroneopterin aldolase [Kocuria palustris]|uniref:dihydroneopterin aldolase n=1 Tax=Kocuria palustris TaxID=71999 RepID=UPI0011A0BCAD|nr:dihydroneopterin aldolase [Kocuria palustris]
MSAGAGLEQPAAGGDRIALRGLTAFGRHGVLEHERREGQEFAVDLVLHLDLEPAGSSDDLTRTVHYGEVAEAVHQEIGGEPLELIEALAQRIARRLLAEHELVEAVEVTVHKPHAPIAVAFDDVAVTVVRRRP